MRAGTANPIIIQNLDLPTVSDALDDTDTDGIRGPDANPKAVNDGTETIVGVHKSSGLDDAGDAVQIKAFNGNRIQVTFTPTGGEFATIKTVIVDNVKPQVVTTSPDIPLIVTDGVNLVFSADVTDGGSGYTSKVGTTAASVNANDDIDDRDGTAGPLVERAVIPAQMAHLTVGSGS